MRISLKQWMSGLLLWTALSLPAQMHTFDGKDSIDRINAIAVYFAPNDREPVQDWRRRVQYFTQRVKAFHDREFVGQSKLTVTILDRAFKGKLPTSGYEDPDANRTFFAIIDEVRTAVSLDNSKGFPILMVFADINHCGFDDWQRICTSANCACQGHPDSCRGFVSGNGTEFPGSPCGGARAMYWKNEHFGAGLTSADGWRIPVKGSDSVAYHESIGHSIGLPHPKPMNDSVMGTAQYRYSLHETWLDEDQKQRLGWRKAPIIRTNLFSSLHARHEPIRPKIQESFDVLVSITDTYSEVELRVEIQTPGSQWKAVPKRDISKHSGRLRWRFQISGFEQETPVAYRVIAKAAKESTEIWGYLKVVDSEAKSKSH